MAAYLIILPVLYLAQPLYDSELHESQRAVNAKVQLDDKRLQLTWHDNAALQYSCGTRKRPDERGNLVFAVVMCQWITRT